MMPGPGGPAQASGQGGRAGWLRPRRRARRAPCRRPPLPDAPRRQHAPHRDAVRTLYSMNAGGCHPTGPQTTDHMWPPARRVQPASTMRAHWEGPQDPGTLSSRVVGHACPLMPGMWSLLYSKTRGERALSSAALSRAPAWCEAGPPPQAGGTSSAAIQDPLAGIECRPSLTETEQARRRHQPPQRWHCCRTHSPTRPGGVRRLPTPSR